MTALFEKYRPACWSDVIGQEKVVKTILRLRDAGGLGGRAYWISGKSGQGKTTIAKLIANEVADPLYQDELDAGELNVSRLSDIERAVALYGAGSRTGRAVIVNEAHGLRKPAVRQLLVFLERLPSHVAFIFTTTTEGMSMFEDDNIDANPLLSRCIILSLAQRDIARPFAKRAKEIAEREGLDGQPIERYVRLVNNKGGNMRAVLQAIESGEMLS